jgi:hypothetical protein
VVFTRKNDTTRCTKTIYSNCSTIHLIFNNTKSFFSNRRNFFDFTFLDSNDTKTKNEENKSENNTEQIELIKKRALHWKIVLNRPEKYNAITQPIYERIIEIFDQDAQDKQLILLSMTEKGKFYSS